jgi:hypothetical protein
LQFVDASTFPCAGLGWGFSRPRDIGSDAAYQQDGPASSGHFDFAAADENGKLSHAWPSQKFCSANGYKSVRRIKSNAVPRLRPLAIEQDRSLPEIELAPGIYNIALYAKLGFGPEAKQCPLPESKTEPGIGAGLHPVAEQDWRFYRE